jgi:predicted lipoprotein
MIVALGWLGCACVPWTVVPIEEETTAADDPAAYVESVWESRLLPAAVRGVALDEARRQAEGATLVSGRGVVLSAEGGSPGGRILVDSEPPDGEADLAILTGPVILGTAVRDSAGFIEFSQFTNQLAYADVAIELNRRVVEEVLDGIEADAGDTVEFRGAWLAGPDGLDELVPLWLEVK